jgi:hypothetical protein
MISTERGKIFILMYVSLEREKEMKMEMERNEYESLDQAPFMIILSRLY